jgi:hypothetical protein
LDSQRGAVETLRSLYVEHADVPNGTLFGGQSLQAMVSWVRDLAETNGSDDDTLAIEHAANASEVAVAVHEVLQIQKERDELAARLNSVCASESWRLGYALTWPVRILRKRDAAGEVTASKAGVPIASTRESGAQN